MVAVSFAQASGAKIDIARYHMINIEKNISSTEIKAYMRDAKDIGMTVINNPKYTCNSIGFSKKNVFEKGTLYGKNTKDGNVAVGAKGDFKVYDFVKYFKDGKYCVETTYAKGDSRYGKGRFASMR